MLLLENIKSDQGFGHLGQHKKAFVVKDYVKYNALAHFIYFVEFKKLLFFYNRSYLKKKICGHFKFCEN